MESKEKILILGGGLDQKKMVEEFKKRGFYTIIVDYYQKPPAKTICDKHYKKSTYDKEAVLEIAKKENVKFVATNSTDQPIVVASYVNEQMENTSRITNQQALEFTNKMYMKRKLKENNIPTADFVIIKDEESLTKVKELTFPIIIKPVDSSGSRGVFILEDNTEITKYYEKARKISQTGTVIAEEFKKGYEISVDAFVLNGTTHVILITDTYKHKLGDDISLCCYSLYPSRVSLEIEEQIKTICSQISTVFEIKDSPIFFQMIVDNDEVFVIEFSARVAGGSKPYLIPFITTFDIVSAYVSLLLNDEVKISTQKRQGYVLMGYVYGNEGIFNRFDGVKSLKDRGIIEEFFEYQLPKSNVRNANNSSDRLGAFLIIGESIKEIDHKIQMINQDLKAYDTNNHDLIIHDLIHI